MFFKPGKCAKPHFCHVFLFLLSEPDPVEDLNVTLSNISSNTTWRGPRRGNVGRYVVTYLFVRNNSRFHRNYTNNTHYELDLLNGYQFTVEIVVEYEGYPSNPVNSSIPVGK